MITHMKGKSMISRGAILTVAMVTALTSGAAIAQQPFVYPTRGQSPQQTEMDRGQCYTWAVQQSGYDPANPPLPPPAPPPSQNNDAAKGLFGGALLGAGIGALSGNHAGEGAAIGGLFGLLRGANKGQQQQQQEQASWNQQQNAFQAQGLNSYQRAFGACMNGRGYSVN